MDDITKTYERLYRDLRSIPRSFPSDLQVRATGHFAPKREWVRRHFERTSFSFILEGRGEYRQDGRTWQVQSPCVIVQRPGVFLEHGPEGEWEELYINYFPELAPVFEARGLLPADKPVWYIRDSGSIRARTRSGPRARL